MTPPSCTRRSAGSHLTVCRHEVPYPHFRVDTLYTHFWVLPADGEGWDWPRWRHPARPPGSGPCSPVRAASVFGRELPPGCGSRAALISGPVNRFTVMGRSRFASLPFASSAVLSAARLVSGAARQGSGPGQCRSARAAAPTGGLPSRFLWLESSSATPPFGGFSPAYFHLILRKPFPGLSGTGGGSLRQSPAFGGIR